MAERLCRENNKYSRGLMAVRRWHFAPRRRRAIERERPMAPVPLRRTARPLVPSQLILYRYNTRGAGRYITGPLYVFSRLHNPSQQDLAVIAIHNNW